MAHILSFTSLEANLDLAGGKGANLARLSRAGFRVPDGFIIPTSQYRLYVASNHLEAGLQAALADLRAEDAAALEQASALIRQLFSQGELPSDTRRAVLQAYASLGGEARLPVAVRSSATAEDLPDLSFAGQQDTFLNVSGEEELLRRVVDCWSSLWTGRAIGYRQRNLIPHREASLAVVVQRMVNSDTSGVLFTANPLTGLLSETVIDATFGLGEALVSGQVDPDHFVVDSRTGEIKSKKLGAKQVATRYLVQGGVESVREQAAERQSLSDEQVQQLAALGQMVQNEYGAPQDIEWAFAEGELYLLQSRPITSLFPLPRLSFDPLVVWFSFGSVQGLVGPMTPLGLETTRYVAAGGGRVFGVKLDPAKVEVFAPAGERIWVKISDFMRHPVGARLFSGMLGFLEPSIGQILGSLAAEPALGTGTGRFKLSTLRSVLHFARLVVGPALKNLRHPEQARPQFEAQVAGQLSALHIPPAADRFGRLENLVAFMEQSVADAFAFLLPKFGRIFMPAMACLNLLNHLCERNEVLDVMRALPDNVTTEMDLALWQAACAIQLDGAAARLFGSTEAAALAAQYLAGGLPPAAQAAVKSFLDRYGMRGVGEIDFGQPRWREDPTPLMHTLQSYLQIDPRFGPGVIFERGAKQAEAAIERLAAQARHQPGGWLKEKLVRGAARRIRLTMGVRESPKFFAIRTMGVARQKLLEVGAEFAGAGTIDRPDDLVFFNMAELKALAQGQPRDWQALVAARRATYQRELRRRQVPRVLVSDGRAFYEGVGALSDTGDVINGIPVSPGVAEGPVRVVLDPRLTRLAPGEILVCPGTDPAWTPLFMAAAALITEVGGVMTHGSVVAREVGIPAVVGVHQATLRLKDGQRIRVDGTQGKILILS